MKIPQRRFNQVPPEAIDIKQINPYNVRKYATKLMKIRAPDVFPNSRFERRA